MEISAHQHLEILKSPAALHTSRKS